MREYFEIFYPNGCQRKILLVDDEMTNLALMRLCLHNLGFDNLLTAANGREALDIYSRIQGEIVLIISDLHMPAMRGDELFWELKRLEHNVRFLLCTGMVCGFDPHSLRQAGLKGFLPKPFTVDQFWTAIADAMM